MRLAARRPGGRRSLGIAACVVAVVAAACVPLKQPAPPPTHYCLEAPPTSPADYERAFDGIRSVDLEWGTADGGAPVRLPDGRVVWIFGDTFIGQVQGGRSMAPGWVFANNSFVLQDGACFQPIMGGMRGARADLIPDPAPNQWYWPMTGVVTNGALQVFLLHMERASGPAAFDWRATGVDVATFALPTLSLVGVSPIAALSRPVGPDGVFVYWANGALVHSDGYVYAYGRNRGGSDPSFEQWAARAPSAAIAGPWEYWTGDDVTPWSTDATLAEPMQFLDKDGNPAELAAGSPPTPGSRPDAHAFIVPHGAGFLASAKLVEVFSDDVSTWYSASPTGPWKYVGRAVTTPRSHPEQMLYLGRVVPDLPGGPIVMWSVQIPGSLEGIANDLTTYSVRFAAPAAAAFPPA